MRLRPLNVAGLLTGVGTKTTRNVANVLISQKQDKEYHHGFSGNHSKRRHAITEENR